MNCKTNFHGLRIVHPQSGKVSRSVVATLLRHELPQTGKEMTDPQVADQLRGMCDTIILEDVNYHIRVKDMVFTHTIDPLEELQRLFPGMH